MIRPEDNLDLSSKKQLVDRRAQSFEKQGASVEESCRNDILALLLTQELRYLELVKRLVERDFKEENKNREKKNAKLKAENKPLLEPLGNPKHFYSKQSVTTYLRKLFEDEYITRNIPENKLSSKKPPLFLTDKGREEARKQGLFNSLKELPFPLVERVILSYKYKVFEHLISISDKPPMKTFRYTSPIEKSKGIKRIPILRGGPFKIPKKELTKEEERRLLKMKLPQQIKEKQRLEMKVIDDTLKEYNFSESEILEMWLKDGSLIADILRFRSEKSEHSQEEIGQMKSRIRENLIIRENLENGILSNVKHLFP